MMWIDKECPSTLIDGEPCVALSKKPHWDSVRIVTSGRRVEDGSD